MPSDLEGLCAYAPSGNVLTVIHQMRERGLKEPITMQLITVAGVAEGNASRTIQALRFLNLIDEDGYLTDNFKALRNTPTDEYPAVLGNILKEAYSHVFMVLDPATANDEQLQNAFRYYEPRAQRQRMTSLFKGLCREAGLISGGSENSKRTRNVNHSKSTIPSSTSRKLPIVAYPATQNGNEALPMPSQSVHQNRHGIAEEYPLLVNLLHQLPQGESKKWSKTRRDKWLQAISANIDLLIDVEEER